MNRQNIIEFCKILQNQSKGFKNRAKKPIFDVEQPIATQSDFSKKVPFFQKDQLGIGPFWRKSDESGQKWILEPLCSKIQLNIEEISSLENF